MKSTVSNAVARLDFISWSVTILLFNAGWVGFLLTGSDDGRLKFEDCDWSMKSIFWAFAARSIFILAFIKAVNDEDWSTFEEYVYCEDGIELLIEAEADADADALAVDPAKSP